MKTTGQKLPTDPGQWDQIILQKLTAKTPTLARTIAAIDVKDADYPKGNLTAQIVAAKGAVLIPLIVRDFKLKPFSVVVHNNMVKALSARTEEEIVFQANFVGNQTVDPQNIQPYNDISRLLSPPLSANTGNGANDYRANKAASALKVASCHTKIKFASALENDHDLLSACARTMPMDSIMNELQQVDTEKQASVPTQRNAIHIQKLQDGRFTMNGLAKEASDLQFLTQHEKSTLMMAGEVLTGTDDLHGIKKATMLSGNMKILKDRGAACVGLSNGHVMKGLFVPRVMTFHNCPTGKGLLISQDKPTTRNSITSHPIGEGTNGISSGNKNRTPFLSDGAGWCYQDNTAGRALDMPVAIDEDTPKMGSYGTFLHKHKQHALEPFLISTIHSISGTTIMTVVTMSGQRAAVEYNKDSECGSDISILTGDITDESVLRHMPVNKLYKIGPMYDFVLLGGRSTAARSPEELVGRELTEAGSDNIVSIKLSADKRYIVCKEGRNSPAMSKLSCQATLIGDGIGAKQAKMMVDKAPVSFAVTSIDAKIKSATDKKTTDEDRRLMTAIYTPEDMPSTMNAKDTEFVRRAKEIEARDSKRKKPFLHNTMKKLTHQHLGIGKGQTKTAQTLANRHRGATGPDDSQIMNTAGQVRTNNTAPVTGEDTNKKMDSKMLSTGVQLNDPEILDSLMAISMSEVDDRVMEYMTSCIADINETIDKVGRILLITMTSEVDLSEDSISELVQKLDSLAWGIKDYASQRDTATQKEQ